MEKLSAALNASKQAGIFFDQSEMEMRKTSWSYTLDVLEEALKFRVSSNLLSSTSLQMLRDTDITIKLIDVIQMEKLII